MVLQGCYVETSRLISTRISGNKAPSIYIKIAIIWWYLRVFQLYVEYFIIHIIVYIVHKAQSSSEWTKQDPVPPSLHWLQYDTIIALAYAIMIPKRDTITSAWWLTHWPHLPRIVGVKDNNCFPQPTKSKLIITNKCEVHYWSWQIERIALLLIVLLITVVCLNTQT